MAEKFILSAADYAIFGIMLAISAGIGVYFKIFGGKQTSTEDYLLAGKDMPIYPVAFSLMATFMSATTLMGIPAEMYLYGTNMTFMNIGFLLGPIIASIVFLPIYFNTGVSTSYEYLEKRFGRSTRGILSAIFLFQNILFNAVTLYAPALALSAVTNLSMWTSVISIGAVCTFYCTLGGMKAVLWSDLFQSILMHICLLAIIIKGSLDLGLQNIFKTAYDGGRILLPTFETDFSRRYTMWSILLQGIIITTYNYGACQIQVQRLLTLKNLQRSRITAIVSAPMLIIFQLLCCLCGIIFYVYFKACDPITSPEKPIHSADQLMPYYISSAMRDYPGLPGICIAGIFSASLSTISSAVNSMAAVTYEDIIRPIWPSHSGSVCITRVASVFYGALSIFLAFVVASLGNLIKANVLIVGMVSGPTLGVYLLAALTRRTNELGVNLGVLAGFIFAGCATFIPNVRHYPTLPVENNCSMSVENMVNYSTSVDYIPENMVNYSTPVDYIPENMVNYSTPVDYIPVNFTDSPEVMLTENIFEDNFPISYMWISPVSLLVCLIVGYFGSWISSFIRGNSKAVPRNLLSPVLQWFGFIKMKMQRETPNNEISKTVNVTVTRF